MELQAVRGDAEGIKATRRDIAQRSRSPAQRKRLAKSLGWGSVALGAAQILVPGLVGRAIGAPSREDTRHILMLCGLRELTVGIALVGSARPRKWMGVRLVGDAIDLGLLAGAMQSRKSDTRRLTWAAMAVGAITLMDAVAFARLGKHPRTSDAGVARERIEHTAAVTILASHETIREAWEQVRGEKPNKHSELLITEAPGERGFEIRLMSSRLRRRAVEAKLRRLKQIAETGEVIASDASIHRGRHPAKPSKRSDIASRERELLR